MKYAIVVLLGISLSVWACGGGEKPPLSPENDLVDSNAGVDAPPASGSAAASASAAPASSAKK